MEKAVSAITDYLNGKKMLQKMLETAVERKIGSEEPGWPPACKGLFYQPRRPVKKSARKEANK